MREIKFRAWDKENKTMVGQMWPRMFINSDGTFGFLEDDIYELMQYTGLKDENDSEIYEGDIVRDFLGNPATVKFGDYSAGGLDYYASPAYGFYIQRRVNGRELKDDTQTITKYTKVIGNIYEDPELLEDKL